jgi:hypothetical protein
MLNNEKSCNNIYYLKISESSSLNGSISLSNCFADHQHQQNLKQINSNETEYSEIVHRSDGLPDWVSRNRDYPYSELSEDIDEIENASKYKSCHHLNGYSYYETKRDDILVGLPDKVTEEGDDEVVVSSDEAAEKAKILSKQELTRMARHTISMRWLRVESTSQDFCNDYRLFI